MGDATIKIQFGEIWLTCNLQQSRWFLAELNGEEMEVTVKEIEAILRKYKKDNF
jgi:hypothetical protein